MGRWAQQQKRGTSGPAGPMASPGLSQVELALVWVWGLADPFRWRIDEGLSVSGPWSEFDSTDGDQRTWADNLQDSLWYRVQGEDASFDAVTGPSNPVQFNGP